MSFLIPYNCIEGACFMNKKIRVTILDDHPIIVRGYVDSLSSTPQIEVAAKINFGEQLEPTLKEHPTDVLLLDVNVPTSADNSNPYPILHAIPKLLQIYSELKILVISMHAERGLIRAVMDAGASGYILKDDHVAANDLGSVVMSVVAGGIYFSQLATNSTPNIYPKMVWKICLRDSWKYYHYPRLTQIVLLHSWQKRCRSAIRQFVICYRLLI